MTAWPRNHGISPRALRKVIYQMTANRPGPKAGVIGDPAYLQSVINRAAAATEVELQVNAWIARHPEFLQR
jgi:hypothetical protein